MSTPKIIHPPNENSDDWTPIIGEETFLLVQMLPEDSRNQVEQAAGTILKNGIHPQTTTPSSQTGLVVGYVQSGKTMSFETVITMAHDNGFPLVILIAGTSNPLLGQSSGRLNRDLRLDDQSRPRRWMRLENPNDAGNHVRALRDTIDAWRQGRDSPAWRYRKTALITVLKQHQRLSALTALLNRLDLSDVPALVVDDEADQVSLNTHVAQRRQSPTYSKLLELRRALPVHTYLQYTATPQAPLLINIIDALSPNFVHVLMPGADYVGGNEFFVDGSPHVRTIPSSELNPTPNAGPPASLEEALRIFMTGVAVGLRASENSGNRSMMVSPSQSTTPHANYYGWVRAIFDRWNQVLDLDDSNRDKVELLSEFEAAHTDLEQTVPGIPDFDELKAHLKSAFLNTSILEVNTRSGRRTPQVPWLNSYGWILVGGQAMDRGFTVEGLTVTYMPRGLGLGNADSMQQRARFFGYKRQYFGFCRVYLEGQTRAAFQQYVEHEKNIRSQLLRIQQTGTPLNDWKRAFVLDSALRPCRQNVLDFDWVRGNYFNNHWFYPKTVLCPQEVASNNLEVAGDVRRSTRWAADTALRCEISRDLSLRSVVESLLAKFRFPDPKDSRNYTGLLLQLSKALEENPAEPATVYIMNNGAIRERPLTTSGQLATYLFQGPAAGTYPGDRNIHEQDAVSIQVHYLNLTDPSTNQTRMANVPVLAVWVPPRLGVPWISQHQQN